jgi:hypothetical protein
MTATLGRRGSEYRDDGFSCWKWAAVERQPAVIDEPKKQKRCTREQDAGGFLEGQMIHHPRRR